MHVCEMSLSLSLSLILSCPSPSCLQPLSLHGATLSLSGWLYLSWSPSPSSPSLPLLPPLSPLSLQNRKRPAKTAISPSTRLPHPFPSPGFFSAPYSRQIKCTQLLPAETGLNCTPVAMAILMISMAGMLPLPISLLGPPGSTAFLAPELPPRSTLAGQRGGPLAPSPSHPGLGHS